MLNQSRSWKGSSSIHFLHNWRSSGTTFHSLLSSNYFRSYHKVGHYFSQFGWPENDKKTQTTRLRTLKQLREAQKQTPGKSVIIGGHLFLGLEAAFPGNWDCWMSAREPISRLVSGLLRFHSRSINHTDIDLMGVESIDFSNPQQVDNFLETTLRRESNGISKRLASFAITKSPLIPVDSNLERLSFLEEEEYDQNELFDAAEANLSRLRILILSDWVHISALCIEKMYNLSSPLINPFSDLHHNPVRLGGNSYKDRRLLDCCGEILHKHTSVDSRIWPLIAAKFASQVDALGIEEDDVKVREMLHTEPLFLPQWFNKDGEIMKESFLHEMAIRLAKRANKAESYKNRLLKTFFSWDGLTDQAKEQLKRIIQPLI